MMEDYMKVKHDYASKPYNRCLSCPNLGVKCDGARSSAMTLQRWCEFMRDMKDVKGLTNAYISEVSGVSIKTIERLMAQNCEQDIMRETARRIEDAIIGSSNTYPCILAFEESKPDEAQTLRDLERALAENRNFNAMLERIQASYDAEIKAIREEAKQKVDFLVKDVDRLQAVVEHLLTENDRKSRIVDKLLEK
jgi:hypothetical protein